MARLMSTKQIRGETQRDGCRTVRQIAEKAFDLEEVGSSQRRGLGSLSWSQLGRSGQDWRVQGNHSPLQMPADHLEVAAEMIVRNENSPQRKKEHGLGREDGQYRRGGSVCDSLDHWGPVYVRGVVLAHGYMVVGIQVVVAVESTLQSAAVVETLEEVVHGHRRAPNPQRDNFRDHLRGLVLDHFADEDMQRVQVRKLALEKKPE